MIFNETKLKGAFIIEQDFLKDSRGFFARSWSEREFAAEGLHPTFVESNISFNIKKGTLRGMHYQTAPYEQPKLVRCSMGAIFDVIIDLRPDSLTYKEWVGVELNAENRRMLYMPAGFAHGFQTLRDNTEIFYQMGQVYAAEHGRGVRWNDPAFGIEWPPDERTIIERDAQYPDFAA